ncbi:MAG: acyl-ACP--UDP-N-acetylglucosamine O-acyltransferase [Flavobacteriales bacterium]|jgi:UDP-N-acetylglucosamine acyltransferase|nr:acyl-ACP--UDP-N-acetylglucosamine O-acyltransferase [Flavobacteriales bacterium]MBK6893574.1 acyl-ACP--UDP-N-acetylglucosamine O-acyltransferase [Flavobacteriales bacterium]MBK7248726.1 acyl-ACP--UDP-N-acetylglucosamine O-acyltransferase [Flavobacteriales bacterium]MBK9059047.1 acyl-ACP--UDP-N-acetylglucosamine O-acyltransferase [Flavobacteriales bacterium]QQS73967.1 MAG: acyl-ACP--UDP-N-acetylglucosamine O-acyltransferase [Flavobacteriales bacterium]
MSISKLASVHPDARIGKDVVIEPFTAVAGDVTIGDGTWIGPNATIMDGARIGARCRIFPGAVVSAIPQDLKFVGERTTAELGDNTTVRECVTINRGTADRQRTAVGSNCLLMAYVHLAHDCLIGDNVVIANSVNLAGHVTIGDWAILEGNVAVQQFINIGAHSFVAGASLVRKNVPPFVKAAREPLSFVGVNVVGLRRRGFADDAVARIEDIYREIFVRNTNLERAVQNVEQQFTVSPERALIIEFIRSSPKGIMRGLTE